ncbi:MAG: NAD(P)-dependent oxidoreductase [Bacteroidota bacterium]|jgi:D-3-phosphoglycerate dehydrogenase
MNQPVVWIADTVHPSLLQGLQSHQYDCIEEYHALPAEFPFTNIRGIVIRSRFFIDEQVINRFPHLRWIARIGAGMENINTSYAASKQIACINAPEGNMTAVAEHTLGMLLSLTKKIYQSANEVRAGIWERPGNRGTELEGKTLAIIGYGLMGSAFCSRLRGLGMEVLVYDKFKKNYLRQEHADFAKEVQLDEIFSRADMLSLHINYLPDNHHLVTASWINQFQKNIYLLNTCRGKVLRTGDMIPLLKSGKILGLGLDVFEEESQSFESFHASPAISQLMTFPNVILTPHIAGWSNESNQKMGMICLKKILALEGA